MSPRDPLEQQEANAPLERHMSITVGDHLRSLVQLLAAIRELRPTAPAGLAEVFLLVCLHEGVTASDLIELSGSYGGGRGQPQSSMSRNLLDLGHRGSYRSVAPGLDLVRWKHDDADFRIKRYHLTPKGRALRDQVLSQSKENHDDAPGRVESRPR